MWLVPDPVAHDFESVLDHHKSPGVNILYDALDVMQFTYANHGIKDSFSLAAISTLAMEL